jgi:hypothetical protein
MWEKLKGNPAIAFHVIAVFIGLSLLVTILVDIFNFFGVKYWMVENLTIPYFWFYWFSIPVEQPMQWYLLGVTLIVFAMNAGRAYHDSDPDAGPFWLLLSAGIMLMLVEDAGDVRHQLRRMLESVTGEEGYGYVGTLFELGYFAVIGLIMLYALLRYRHVYWQHNRMRNWLFAGYLFYGLAVSLSFIGSAFRSVTGFSVYQRTGEMVLKNLFVRDRITEEAYMIASSRRNVDFHIMDRLVEESIELLGVAALLTAGLYFYSRYKKQERD